MNKFILTSLWLLLGLTASAQSIDAYIQKASEAQNAGNYAEMEKQLAKARPLAIGLFDRRENVLWFPYVMYLNGVAVLAQNRYDEGIEELKKGVELFGRIVGDTHEQYLSKQLFLAKTYKSFGKDAETVAAYQTLLNVYERTGHKKNDYAVILNNLGTHHADRGRFEAAEPLIKESVEIFKKLYGENHEFYATALNNMGTFYQEIGQHEQARACFQKSVNILRKTSGRMNLSYGSAASNLGLNYTMQKKYELAEPWVKEGLEVRKELLGTGHSEYAISLNNLAAAYCGTGRNAEARPLIEESRKIMQNVYGTQSQGYGVTLNNTGTFYMTINDYAKATPLLKEAGSILNKTIGNKHPLYTMSLAALAVVYTHTGEYSLADAYWNEGSTLNIYHIHEYFPFMSEKEKEGFYLTRKDYFESFNSYALMRHTTSPGILATMYNNQLATKALLFNASNQLRLSIAGGTNTQLKDDYKQWADTKEQFIKLKQAGTVELKAAGINIDSLAAVLENMEKKLVKQSAAFDNLKKDRELKWTDVRDRLKPGEAAVEMIRFRQYLYDSGGRFTDTVRYAALIVKHDTKDRPRLVYLANGNELEERAFKKYRLTRKKTLLPDNSSYDAYWKPLKPELKGIKKVYFSPDGVYNLINLNTLENPETKQFLFEETEIRPVTNTKDLVMTVPAGSRPNTSVLIGMPDYELSPEKRTEHVYASAGASVANRLYYVLDLERSGTFTPLPATKTEIEKINTITSRHRWTNTVLLNEKALEENIKAVKSPKVLHIATHGFFMDDRQTGSQSGKPANPLVKSGLILAGAKHAKNVHYAGGNLPTPEDGILTALEAMTLNLDQTELVVLSACETGLGEVVNGEGVYGLQRAFKIAGAQSIIMSMWTVDDKTTQELMTGFYEAWLQTGDKIAAFRTAQLSIKARNPHPYYWGAFVLVGE